jgi:phage terminase large subunit
VDIVWVEEAQTVTKKSWDTLIPTIRKDDSEIWVSFNPNLETDETYRRFIVNKPPNAIVVKVNHYDNPWFPSALKKEMESMRNSDIEAYNNVWEGACKKVVEGAIFAKELQRAEIEGRITNVPYDPIKPVHAVCDLGWSDSTAWWFVQFVGMETRLIRYLEDSQRTMTSYLSELQSFGYVYDTIWLPHDAKSKTIASAGKSISDIVRSAGFRTEVLDPVPVVDSINAARTIFPNIYIDNAKCFDGINCLRNYRYKVDSETKQFSKEPLHDLYSHGADAFRYIALMVKERRQVKKTVVQPMTQNWMS